MEENLYTSTIINKHVNSKPVVPFIRLPIGESALVVFLPPVVMLTLVVTKADHLYVALFISITPAIAYVYWVRKKLKEDPRFRLALKNKGKRLKPMVKKRNFIA